jgi:uncharacterized MnhB-related membrane protein
MPYCDEHAAAFQRRQRYYHLFQAVFFLSGMLIVVLSDHWQPRTPSTIFHSNSGMPTYGIVAIALILISIAMLFLKQRILYDARIRNERSGLMIKAPSAEFIAGMDRAMAEASDLSRQEAAKPVDPKIKEAKRKTHMRRLRDRLHRKE